MSTTFYVPMAIVTGGGCRAEVAEGVRRLGIQKVLIVTDTGLVERGVIGEFVAQFLGKGMGVQIFDGVQADPTDVNVREGVAAFEESGAQAIVAIGGGSPIDTAKAMSVSVTNPGPLSQFQGYHKVKQPGPPVIAVPTTAGTGSEATRVAVITDTERQVKMMMLDAKLMPLLAYVDYELSLSMPRPLTAHVGVDTLTHGIEAYVSRKANGMSDAMALSCIDLCARFLRRAWTNGEDREAREGMALAALQGGMAFTNSALCLVHGMSRPLGAVFHLAHGLSNAVLLPTVTRYSISGARERYDRVAQVMGFGGVDGLVAGLEQLNRDLEVPTLRECLVGKEEEFEAMKRKMASDAIESGSPANNPVVPEAEEIVALYGEAWELR